MAFYQWSDDLSVNIPSIDRQHQVLIGYINELHDTVDTPNARQLTGKILQKLVNYTTVHFIYEEMLFGAYHYADEAEHRKAHQRFIDQIAAMQTQCNAGDTSVPAKLLDMLKSWLTHHILKEDMAYSKFLLQQGVL